MDGNFQKMPIVGLKQYYYKALCVYVHLVDFTSTIIRKILSYSARNTCYV